MERGKSLRQIRRGVLVIDYESLKALAARDIEHRYAEKDAILYALGLGFGADPTDERELPYVYEGPEFRVMPTMAVILGYPGFWLNRRETGVDWMRVVHGEQRLRLFRPLPRAGTVHGRVRLAGLTDKGEGKGAVLVTERRIEDESGQLLATAGMVTLLRGDGGYSRAGQPSDPLPEPLPPMPDRPPDRRVALPTRPDLALLYRLSGDFNPLHADPAVARKAGFERPILHGLATFGVAARAVAATGGQNAVALRRFDGRFSAPVYPGETLVTDIWVDGALVRFRTRAAERDAVVLDLGVAEFGEGP